jgi:hypothetical protein
MVIDQNNAKIVIKNSKFNGLNCGSPQLSTFISANEITLQYTWFLNGPQQILDTGCAAVDYRYDLLDNMIIGTSQHMNYQQLSCGGVNGPLTVKFNTTYQTSLGGAEGFQFYDNNSAGSLTNPTFSNNTMIARPSSNQQTMSYMVHGNCHSGGDCSTTTTSIVGSAMNTQNYFDASGAYGVYYPSSFAIPGAGWTPRSLVVGNSYAD